jgi:hypothetical protein
LISLPLGAQLVGDNADTKPLVDKALAELPNYLKKLYADTTTNGNTTLPDQKQPAPNPMQMKITAALNPPLHSQSQLQNQNSQPHEQIVPRQLPKQSPDDDLPERLPKPAIPCPPIVTSGVASAAEQQPNFPPERISPNVAAAMRIITASLGISRPSPNSSGGLGTAASRYDNDKPIPPIQQKQQPASTMPLKPSLETGSSKYPLSVHQSPPVSAKNIQLPAAPPTGSMDSDINADLRQYDDEWDVPLPRERKEEQKQKQSEPPKAVAQPPSQHHPVSRPQIQQNITVAQDNKQPAVIISPEIPSREQQLYDLQRVLESFVRLLARSLIPFLLQPGGRWTPACMPSWWNSSDTTSQSCFSMFEQKFSNNGLVAVEKKVKVDQESAALVCLMALKVVEVLADKKLMFDSGVYTHDRIPREAAPMVATMMKKAQMWFKFLAAPGDAVELPASSQKNQNLNSPIASTDSTKNLKLEEFQTHVTLNLRELRNALFLADKLWIANIITGAPGENGVDMDLMLAEEFKMNKEQAVKTLKELDQVLGRLQSFNSGGSNTGDSVNSVAHIENSGEQGDGGRQVGLPEEGVTRLRDGKILFGAVPENSTAVPVSKGAGGIPPQEISGAALGARIAASKSVNPIEIKPEKPMEAQNGTRSIVSASSSHEISASTTTTPLITQSTASASVHSIPSAMARPEKLASAAATQATDTISMALQTTKASAPLAQPPTAAAAKKPSGPQSVKFKFSESLPILEIFENDDLLKKVNEYVRQNQLAAKKGLVSVTYIISHVGIYLMRLCLVALLLSRLIIVNLYY